MSRGRRHATEREAVLFNDQFEYIIYEEQKKKKKKKAI